MLKPFDLESIGSNATSRRIHSFGFQRPPIRAVEGHRGYPTRGQMRPGAFCSPIRASFWLSLVTEIWFIYESEEFNHLQS